ncbi:exosome complex component RRP42-like [Chenopodium quinoa]|uniref:exosome complex component RRP42-like n=1 Tax=Chenopodium quinoa TaxID=63459 RepID=UPI000B76CF39|nr:exosome complex component RRP42-like [Chenopodium quinoa]
MVRLSFGEKNFIRGGIAQNLRCDGRKRLSVKAELGRPNLSQPDKGKVSIHIDCSATAAPIFQSQGKGGEALSTELAADLQCCLLDGKSGAGAGIDLSSLSIVEGKVCWDLYIDGLVVSSDGNMLDTLGAAIKATLSDTGIPKVNVIAADSTSAGDQPEVDVSDEEFLQFNTSAVPVIVTVTKVGKHYIVDATEEEESQMSSAMSVSINRKGLICGLSKRGGAGVDPSIVLDMISVTKHVSENFVNKLDSEIAAAEAPEEES